MELWKVTQRRPRLNIYNRYTRSKWKQIKTGETHTLQIMPIKDDDHLNPKTMQHIVIIRLKAQIKTLPEAQRTQDIESKTWIISKKRLQIPI